MTQCILYAKCHGKVVKSFKARPPKLVVLGSSVYCRWHARLVAKGRDGAINPKLLVPRRRLPSKRVLRQRLVCPRLCSLRPLHGGASFSASPGQCFRVPGSFLPSAWGKVVDALLGRVRCHK
jgi:hypothetical protein